MIFLQFFGKLVIFLVVWDETTKIFPQERVRKLGKFLPKRISAPGTCSYNYAVLVAYAVSQTCSRRVLSTYTLFWLFGRHRNPDFSSPVAGLLARQQLLPSWQQHAGTTFPSYDTPLRNHEQPCTMLRYIIPRLTIFDIRRVFFVSAAPTFQGENAPWMLEVSRVQTLLKGKYPAEAVVRELNFGVASSIFSASNTIFRL